MTHQETPQLWPFLVYAAIVALVVIVMIGLSYLLGERHAESKTNEPFESGIPVTGNARLRFTSHFFLIALFFVVFDLDAVFVIAWAVSFRESGWPGYIAMTVFVFMLFVIILYEARNGAFDFAADGKKILRITQLRKKRKGNHSPQSDN